MPQPTLIYALRRHFEKALFSEKNKKEKGKRRKKEGEEEGERGREEKRKEKKCGKDPKSAQNMFKISVVQSNNNMKCCFSMRKMDVEV